MRRAFLLFGATLALAGPLVSPSAGSLRLQPLTIGKIDYLSNEPATDRFTFPDPYPSVEANMWASPGYAPVTSVVYPRGDTIQVELTIYNPNGIATVGTFRFENGLFTRPGTEEYEIDDHIQSITVPPHGTTTVTVTLDGVPNLVTAGWFVADVTIDPEQGMWLDGGLSELIYLTEAAPIGLMQPVWIEVLNDACIWADGDTTASAAAHDLTFGLNYNMVFVYDGGPPHYFKRDEEGDYYYLLKKFFDSRDTYPYWINGDCRDVSGYLFLLMKALGLNSSMAEEWPATGDAIWTNPICPIGSDMTDIGNYDATGWTFHQITYWASNIYDACASHVYDLSGVTYMNPPAAWSSSGYWQTSNAGWPGPTGYPYRYWGLVDGYFVLDAESEPPTYIIYPSAQVGRSEYGRSLGYLSVASS